MVSTAFLVVISVTAYTLKTDGLRYPFIPRQAHFLPMIKLTKISKVNDQVKQYVPDVTNIVCEQLALFTFYQYMTLCPQFIISHDIIFSDKGTLDVSFIPLIELRHCSCSLVLCCFGVTTLRVRS